MEIVQLNSLIDSIKGSDINEFIFENGQQKLIIRRALQGHVAAHRQNDKNEGAEVTDEIIQVAETAAEVSAASNPAAEVPLDEDCHLVTAKMVGTFYAQSRPGAAPYVKVGDRVKKGQVLCLIEAMKVNFEIEAEVDGVIERIYVKNEQPVQYGQKLMAIRES